MLLVRIIILKLLIICSTSSLDIIELTINKEEHIGMPKNSNIWLTENKPFNFHIVTDQKLERIWCNTANHVTFTKVLKSISNAIYILRENVITNKYMEGSWKCIVFFKSDNTSQEVNIEKVNVDVNECDSKPCHALANCANTFGSYTCTCPEGYQGDGFNCQVVNPCKYKPCHEMAVCKNTDHTYLCSCPAGFTGDGFNSCVDVDECQHNMCHPSLRCVNTVGGFQCNCQNGYTWDAYSKTCIDLNECSETSVCSINSFCENTVGSYRCKCNDGYGRNATGWCVDKNECHMNDLVCKKGELCFNTEGSFKCLRCPENFIWDKTGINCICRDTYILYNKSCIYNECINTYCGLRARCKMVHFVAQCYCPHGTTGNPEKECAHIAEPQMQPIRELWNNRNLEPFINIFIYKRNESLTKRITGQRGLILDKSFTISVNAKDVNFTKKTKRIKCHKQGYQKEVLLNQPLEPGIDSKYVAKVPKAYNSMNGSWICLIYGSAIYSSMEITFSVMINKEVVITAPPVKKAYIPTDGIIYIELGNNATSNNNKLLLNRNFIIIVKKTTPQIGRLNKIKCHFRDNEDLKYTENENLTWNSVEKFYQVQEGKAKKFMNNEWKCTIISVKNTVVSELTFNVAVKNPEFKSHSTLLVNDEIVSTKKVDRDNMGFAASGTYEYFKGEMVKVSCNRISGFLMNMSYYEDDNNKIVTKKSDTSLQTMYLKMKRGSHTVLCNVQVDVMNEHYGQSIGLILKEQKRKNDLPKFTVNGLILSPRLSGIDSDKYTLFYEYFEGEWIKLTVTNRRGWIKLSGLGNVDFDNGELTFEDYGKKQTATFSLDGNSKTLIFNLRPIRDNFAPQIPIINGLPFSQTEMKYTFNKTTYKTNFFNQKNNILNLTYSSAEDRTECMWEQASDKFTNESIKLFSKNFTFSPGDSEKSVIKCKCIARYLTKEFTHEITIIRDNDKKTSSKRTQGNEENDESAPDLAYIAEDNNKIDSEETFGESQEKTTPSDEGIDWTLIVIIAAALSVVIAVVWLMVGLHKRRQRREKALQTEINYESLQNNTDGSMPTPPQWDNYDLPVDRQNVNDTDTYSVPYREQNIEEMYAKPQPKTLRKPPKETLYAEPSYASVDLKGEKSEYANLKQKPAEYSQIQHKKIGNPNTPKVLPSEEPYAQVLPKSMRPNKESSKYVNVFDNQRYVNSGKGEASQDGSEYAEPAYCEVGTKK